MAGKFDPALEHSLAVDNDGMAWAVLDSISQKHEGDLSEMIENGLDGVKRALQEATRSIVRLYDFIQMNC